MGESKFLMIDKRLDIYSLIEEKSDIYENFVAMKAAYISTREDISLIGLSNITTPKKKTSSPIRVAVVVVTGWGIIKLIFPIYSRLALTYSQYHQQ